MRKIFIILAFACIANTANAQYTAVRVNALGLVTGTLNAGVDIAVADKWSIDVSALYNPLKTNAFRCQALALTAGVRKWRFEPHVGAFWGLHTTAAKYDFGDKIQHYDGWLTGIGASYGYSWMLSTRWNFTLEAGLGLFYMQDKRQSYYTPPLDDIFIYHYRRLVLAPSKLEISFSYLF